MLWQPNEIFTGHKTYKLGRQSSNGHNCQIWFTLLQWLWRKCNLTIFSYKSMGVFCCHGNQTKRQIGRLLAIFNCPYPFNICTKLESFCSVVLEELSLKKKSPFFFLNLMLPWQPNKIVTGHKTHKLGRQSSNDQNCQIWFTSLQRLWNLTIFSYKFMGVFSCHGNQLADFQLFSVVLTQATFVLNYSPTASVVLEE